jgi:hypothetical protein
VFKEKRICRGKLKTCEFSIYVSFISEYEGVKFLSTLQNVTTFSQQRAFIKSPETGEPSSQAIISHEVICPEKDILDATASPIQ